MIMYLYVHEYMYVCACMHACRQACMSLYINMSHRGVFQDN